MEFSRTHKICALIIGFLEYILFSGIIYGWADLVYVLKLEGVFYDGCNNNTTKAQLHETPDYRNVTCSNQDNLFDLAFTIASLSKGIAACLMGLLLDWAGLRIVRITSTCFILIGGIFLAICSKDNPYYLFPGSLLVGLGGNEIRFTNFQIANMFPKYKATIMAIYNGGYCGSPAILLLLKFCFEQGISRSAFFYVWTGISATMFFTSFFLLPKDNIIAIESDTSYCKESDKSINNNEDCRQPLLPPENDGNDNLSNNNLIQSIRSLSYILHLICNGTLAVALVVYIGTFNWWITKINKDPKEVSKVSEMYGYSQLPMIFVSPFIGLLMDYTLNKAQREEDRLLRKKKLQRAGLLSLLITSTVVTLMSACRLFSNETAIYVSLVFYVFSRPIINSVNPGYIRIRFPQEQFNKLMGLFGTLSSIYSIVQYPLFLWMQKNFLISNIFFVVLLSATVINPLHLLCLKPTDV